MLPCMTAGSSKEANNKARVLFKHIQNIHSKRSRLYNHGNKAHHEKHAVIDMDVCTLPEDVDT